jgi:hypothetical protein
MLAEILIIIVVAVILTVIGYFSFNVLKKDIDAKASIDTLTDTVNQVNTNDSSLIQQQTVLQSSFSNNNTTFNSMFTGLNSNVTQNKATIDLMNTNIYQLQGNFTSNNNALSNLNTNFDAHLIDYSSFSSNTNSNIANITNTYVSKDFLKSDLASIDNNVFTLAPKGYSSVNVTGKPLTVDSINMNLWQITPQNDKLCFSQNNVKAMCITSQPTGIEVYKADGTTIVLPTTTNTVSSTVPPVTKTSTVAPFTNKNKSEKKYTENFIRASQ